MPPCEGSDVGCNKIPAERGNDMQLDRCFQIPDSLPARVSVFISSWLIFILPDFSICSRRLITNSWKKLLLLALQEGIANLVALGGEVAWDGDCTSVTAITTPLAPLLIGPLMSPASCLKATAACPSSIRYREPVHRVKRTRSSSP